MRVRFWGTRGSLPTALTGAQVRSKVVSALEAAAGRRFADRTEIAAFVDRELDFATARTYGGATSCVEIETGGPEYLVFDMGSGAREFGNAAATGRWPDKRPVFHIVMSHAHWDHIMGFPFFTPAYLPDSKIVIYGCHDAIERIFRTQHSHPFFPVEFDELAADIEFVTLPDSGVHDVAGCRLTPMKQHHESDSYAYRLERDGKSVIYATDGEHRIEELDEIEAVVDFYRGADLLIFDAMYSLADAVTVKADWGHSNNIIAVELAARAKVEHLCLFHHEPTNDDAALARIERETLRYLEISLPDSGLRISTAFDGLELDV